MFFGSRPVEDRVWLAVVALLAAADPADLPPRRVVKRQPGRPENIEARRIRVGVPLAIAFLQHRHARVTPEPVVQPARVAQGRGLSHLLRGRFRRS